MTFLLVLGSRCRARDERPYCWPLTIMSFLTHGFGDAHIIRVGRKRVASCFGRLVFGRKMNPAEIGKTAERGMHGRPPLAPYDCFFQGCNAVREGLVPYVDFVDANRKLLVPFHFFVYLAKRTWRGGSCRQAVIVDAGKAMLSSSGSRVVGKRGRVRSLSHMTDDARCALSHAGLTPAIVTVLLVGVSAVHFLSVDDASA